MIVQTHTSKHTHTYRDTHTLTLEFPFVISSDTRFNTLATFVCLFCLFLFSLFLFLLVPEEEVRDSLLSYLYYPSMSSSPRCESLFGLTLVLAKHTSISLSLHLHLSKLNSLYLIVAAFNCVQMEKNGNKISSLIFGEEKKQKEKKSFLLSTDDKRIYLPLPLADEFNPCKLKYWGLKNTFLSRVSSLSLFPSLSFKSACVSCWDLEPVSHCFDWGSAWLTEWCGCGI